MEPMFKTIHDAATGKTWQEELTDEDIANIPAPVFIYEQSVDDLVEGEELPEEPADDPVEGEQP